MQCACVTIAACRLITKKYVAASVRRIYARVITINTHTYTYIYVNSSYRIWIVIENLNISSTPDIWREKSATFVHDVTYVTFVFDMLHYNLIYTLQHKNSRTSIDVELFQRVSGQNLRYSIHKCVFVHQDDSLWVVRMICFCSWCFTQLRSNNCGPQRAWSSVIIIWFRGVLLLFFCLLKRFAAVDVVCEIRLQKGIFFIPTHCTVAWLHRKLRNLICISGHSLARLHHRSPARTIVINIYFRSGDGTVLFSRESSRCAPTWW